MLYLLCALPQLITQKWRSRVNMDLSMPAFCFTWTSSSLAVTRLQVEWHAWPNHTGIENFCKVLTNVKKLKTSHSSRLSCAEIIDFFFPITVSIIIPSKTFRFGIQSKSIRYCCLRADTIKWNIRPQSPQLAEPLWTDPGLKSGISVRELIFTWKKRKKR